MEQLHQSLPHAAPGPDGCDGALQRPRQCAAGPDRPAMWFPRKTGHGWEQGVGCLQERRDRSDQELLRDRCGEYLPSLLAIPVDAGAIKSRMLCKRN